MLRYVMLCYHIQPKLLNTSENLFYYHWACRVLEFGAYIIKTWH